MSLPDLYYEITNFKAAVESSCTPSSSLDSQGVQMLEGACQNSVKQLRSMLRCHSVASTQSAAKQDSNSQAPKPQVIQVCAGRNSVVCWQHHVDEHDTACVNTVVHDIACPQLSVHTVCNCIAPCLPEACQICTKCWIEKRASTHTK